MASPLLNALRSLVKSEFAWSYSNDAGTVEIFKNPSSKELNEVGNSWHEDIRAMITSTDLYIWPGWVALHYEVEQQLKNAGLIKGDPVPLMLFRDGSKVAAVMVTDSSKRGIWDQNPKVKDSILHNPVLKRLAIPDFDIHYYNEDIVGPWA